MSNSSIPVVIIGAGPAGCAASFVLTRAQIHHLIIDKAVFPRDKICGDALSGKVIDTLKGIKPELVEEMEQSNEFLSTQGIQFSAPNGKCLDIPFPARPDGYSTGYVSKRKTFDNLLFNHISSTYAKVYQGAKVQKISQSKDKVNLEFDAENKTFCYESQFLIAADGPKSVVRKKMAASNFEDKHHSVALRSYCKGVEGLHGQGFLELHFMKEAMPGYFWIFPLPNNEANVGLGMLTSKVKADNINLRALFMQVLAENPKIKERFRNAEIGEIKGWSLPLGSKWIKKQKHRILYTGDAAGLVDPFTGEGIGNAVVSGAKAADVITKALDEDNWQSIVNEYDNWLKKQLFDELRLSYRLQKLSSIPWLFNFVVNKAHSSPKIQELMTCMFADLEIREQLKKPGFYLRLLTGRL